MVLSVLVRFRCATSFETPWQIPNISFGLCFVWLFHVRFFFTVTVGLKISRVFLQHDLVKSNCESNTFQHYTLSESCP